MADFPQLEPIDRSYAMGAHLISAHEGQNGDPTQFLHSVYAADVTIALEFRSLTSTQMALIRSHYAGQRGGCLPFEIPAALWRTHANLYDVVLPGMSYRYAGPFTETRRSGGLFDVSISLTSHYS